MAESEEEWWKNLEAAKPEDVREELRIAKVAMTFNDWSKVEHIAREKGLTFSQAVRLMIEQSWMIEMAFKRQSVWYEKYWWYRLSCWLGRHKDTIILHRKSLKSDE